ncbi:MAG: oligosaccharide flippase family protein [Verrucomicrobiales bacterium]|nr:oligosaccharide flippase family protein [Verrucomicrobiales bacterium]
MSLFSKLARSSSFSLLDQAVKLGFLFVTTPLMVSRLGEENYGTWLLALAIVAYFRLLDLGLSFSGARFLGRALGAKNRDEVEDLLHTLHRLFVGIGLLVVTLAALAAFVMPIFFEDPAMGKMMRILIGGFGLATAIRFFTRIFEVILKSHVRYDLISIASFLKVTIQGSLIIFFLLQGYGLFALLVIYLVSDLLDQLLLFVFARRLETISPIPSGQRTIDRKQLPELLKYSATAVAASTGQSLRGGVDPLIIAPVSGVAMVPVYGIGARFLSVFTDIINAIFGGSFVAAFSQVHGRNDTDLLERSFLTSIRYCAAIAALGGCALLFYGPAFIQRWVGEGFADSGKVLVILTFPTVCALAQYPIWSFFYSQNKQALLAYLTLGGGVFNLLLSLILAQQIGFFGVVWATFVEMILAYALLVPWMVTRVSAIPIGKYLSAILSPVLKVAAFSLLYFLLIYNQIAPDYFRLLLLGMGHLVFLLPIFWFLVLESTDRQRLLALFIRGNR